MYTLEKSVDITVYSRLTMLYDENPGMEEESKT